MTVDCFIPFRDKTQASATVNSLRALPAVRSVRLLADSGGALPNVDGAQYVTVGPVCGSRALAEMARVASADYVLLGTKPCALRPGRFALERMARVARDTGAGLLYSDRYLWRKGASRPAPTIDYQQGSLRDDFDFGELMFFPAETFKRAVGQMEGELTYAGLYDLRLRVAECSPVVHINEYLYTETDDASETGAGQFDYVDPKNRAAQMEMEDVCTAHLKRVGAWLPPRTELVDVSGGEFACEASVIVPVRNRVKTIVDALQSALGQVTDFPYNVLVVDNHSTDGTTEAIRHLADDPRLIHIVPKVHGLGIGGCWNEAIIHPACGRFAVQLDSDDLYAATDTLQRIVETFHTRRCAMLVGSYQLTDFELRPLPPGVIDHCEWTDENGHNNLLRINGIGAPRAFFTPVLRQITVPDTSYGEDYALALTFSRRYHIERLYDVLYLCRRWEGNSDAAPDHAKVNANNFYKDRLRTWEIQARIQANGH